MKSVVLINLLSQMKEHSSKNLQNDNRFLCLLYMARKELKDISKYTKIGWGVTKLIIQELFSEEEKG